MTRVLVLMGGRSGEHDVSLVSARGVLGALAEGGLDATPVLIDRDGAWTRDGRPVMLGPGPDGRGVLMPLDGGEPEPVDVVFPVLHGPNGEDGTVQGLCEMARIPYVGAGVAASAVAMDKALFKALAMGHDLPVAEAVVIGPSDWDGQPDAVRRQVAQVVGYPCFCKPARLGSSVGISKVDAADGLAAAVALALEHDATVLIERAVPSPRELEVGVLGAPGDVVVSPPGEITYDADWYDYETKYTAGRAEVTIPAAAEPALAQRLRGLAEAAFEMVGCHGLARVDFLVDPSGAVFVSELNTMPGFTPTSAYPSLMAAAGVPYTELVTRLIELAMGRHQRHAVLRR